VVLSCHVPPAVRTPNLVDWRKHEARNKDNNNKLIKVIMAEKTFCVICDKGVEIVRIVPHGAYDEQKLSCDHIGRKLNFSPEEREKETSLH
jgi:hypothetical protein